MAKRHVYHWKHGWIPLTHTAAMSKAKGNREKAAELLRDAHDKGAGIHKREHVGTAALDLTSIADANERADALVDVQDAAERLGAHDLLPKALQRPSTPKADGHKVTKADVYGDGRIDEVTMPSGHKVQVERKTGRLARGLWEPDASGKYADEANPGAFTKHYVGRSDSHDDHTTLNGYTPGELAPKTDAPSTPKAAPKSRAQGIILDGRTDADRYHYRKTDGTLEPQNDRVVNRLKRLEASARKADREGDVFGAHKARQEFASLTGERRSAITYQAGHAPSADAGLPDGYKVKRDVIDGYGPVNTYSVHDASGKRVGTGYNSPDAASRAAHKHHTRAQQAEADRVALQQRLKAEREQREAAHAKVVADGRAKYAQPDTVDVADQVATNHLVERMHNAPGAMQAGELAKIAGSSHVAQHHRDRAQTELNAQALKRVQFMDGANDERALNARLVDARHMPDGPMKVALIDALERQLANVRGGSSSSSPKVWTSPRGMHVPLKDVDEAHLADLYAAETNDADPGAFTRAFDKANTATRHAFKAGYRNPRVADRGSFT